MRTILRRLTGVLSFLAVQVSLLGSAAACLSLSAQRVADADGTALAVTTPASPTDSGDHHCATPSEDSHAPSPTEQHCATMNICAFTLDAPTTMTVTVASSRVVSRVDGISERRPMSYVVAPELPPPRV